MSGTFIVVEGLDGSGKTTVINKLAESLRAEGKDVLIYSDFYTDPFAAKIGQAIKSSNADDIDPIANVLAITAMRRNGVSKVVAPHLDKGGVVIADRFILSTMAYQSAEHELSLARTVRAITSRVHFPQFTIAPLQASAVTVSPNLTLYLDLPAHVALERLRQRGDKADYFESKGPEFFTLVATYFKLVKGIVHNQNIVNIDAEQSEEDVFTDVLNSVKAFVG